MTATKDKDTKLTEYVRRGKEQVTGRVDAARDATSELIDARTDDVGRALDRLSGALKQASEAIEHAGEDLGQRAGSAAARVDRAAKYLQKNDPEVFLNDVEDLSRRHMGWTIAVAFLAGVITARLTSSR